MSVRLPDELQEKLDAAADEEGASRREVVREALSTYLELREFQRLRREIDEQVETRIVEPADFWKIG